jgi:starch-binding outer membrane protein, SusD/RagB family
MQRMMRKTAGRATVAVLGAALAVTACDVDLDVPSLNNPIVGGPASRSSVIATAQGLIGNARGLSTGTVNLFGIWGRELYVLAPQEPRPYQENLIGPTRDPVSNGTGAGFNYGTVVEIRALLDALDAVGSEMSEQEKEGIRGWAKTIAGYVYFLTALIHPEFGAPAGPPENPTGELEPILTADELWAEAFRYYDEAFAHLQNAGSSFAFSLTEGYDGFDTPADFARANRALKVRALKYAGDFQGVLTTLPQTFIDPGGDLDLGVYHNYFAADNAFNPFFSPTNSYVHPRILANAQEKANGEKDDRAEEKTRVIDPFTPFPNLTVTERPTIFNENVSPFPWITNEELILLRAEARLATGDEAGALADVNIIRTRAGGLPPASGLSGEALLTEILYNKLYSLLFKGGWSYFDAKQYDRLDELPRALPTHVVFDRINWPLNECTARDMSSGPCGTITGS